MFNKKKIEELESRIEKLSNEQTEYEKQLKRVRKLERIVKYAKDDESTFCFCDRWCASRLYLYVNKEEYIIELAELGYTSEIVEESLEIYNDRAYFMVTEIDDDVNKTYLFIIDYLNDRYVLNSIVVAKNEDSK